MNNSSCNSQRKRSNSPFASDADTLDKIGLHVSASVPFLAFSGGFGVVDGFGVEVLKLQR